MIKKIVLFLFISFSSLNAQNSPLSENAKVSIFTCGKGDELYTVFGHTAIRIQDPINQLDVVYNYGMFDFSEGNFYLKFVKGDLKYFVAATSYTDFLYEYQLTEREVIEQTLNLPLAKKQELFELLNTSLFSEERFYTYKFIDRNCTTMVVEKVNKILGNTQIQKVDDKSITYRELFYPYFKNHFWYKLGINIIFGTKVDQKAEKLFLPIEFLHSLNKAKINEKPLVEKEEIVLKGNQPVGSFSFFNSIYFVALLMLIMALINNKVLFKTYLILAGLLGIFLCVVGLYSFHEELLWNYNALLFNPLFVILPFVKNKKLLFTCFGMLVFYAFYMWNKPHLTLMIPFVVFTGFVLLKLKNESKRPKIIL